MKKVKVIEDSFLAPLEKKAEKLINDGWEPVGGLAVSSAPMGRPIMAWAFTREDNSELGDVQHPQPIG